MKAGSTPLGFLKLVIARASWANLGSPDWMRVLTSLGDKMIAARPHLIRVGQHRTEL
jgi:hypothetical protein